MPSCGPPAANGMTRVIGRVGKSCACAPLTRAARPRQTAIRCVCMDLPPVGCFSLLPPADRGSSWTLQIGSVQSSIAYGINTAAQGTKHEAHVDPRRHRRSRNRRPDAGAAAWPAGSPACELACVASRDQAKAQGLAGRAGDRLSGGAAGRLAATMPILRSNARPAMRIEDICRPMLSAGKRVMVLSAGALLPRPELIELAKPHGGQIIVPTGALLGLDAVTAAAEGDIHSVRMITRKPPNGLDGARYLVAQRHFGRRPDRAEARVCRHGARGCGRLSGERQCGGGAGARRHRARSHHDRDLGRPGAQAQLSHHRGRGRLRALFVFRSRTCPRKIRRPDGSPRCR